MSLYTGSISNRINTSLRKGALCDGFSHFEGLQFDLCQNTLPESITTWRYVTLQEMLSLWWATIFGRVYVNPAFVSTTLLRDFFSGQACSNGIVIRINAPKGTPGMYITELNNAAIVSMKCYLHIIYRLSAQANLHINYSRLWQTSTVGNMSTNPITINHN